jgi:hypothetical protein
MSLIRRQINARDVELASTAESVLGMREPPLTLGNFVRLNSGGPIMMVIDHDGADAVFALAGSFREDL